MLVGIPGDRPTGGRDSQR